MNGLIISTCISLIYVLLCSEALRQHSSLILSEDSMNAIFYEETSSEEEEEEEREGVPLSDTPAAVIEEEESWD